MKVAVVGVSGGMGSLFAKYFLSRRFEVAGSDLRRTTIGSPRFRYFRSNPEAVRGARFTILATPIDETLHVAEDVLPAMANASTLVDISSVKGKMLSELERMVSESGKRLLSTHPLFGPSIKSFNAMKILVVTSRRDSDLKIARTLFPRVALIAVSRHQHDRLMALTLSLQHALNLVYASTLAEFISPSEFRTFSTPNSLVQLTLAEGVLSQDPLLYSYIQTENDHSKRVLNVLAREVAKVRRFVNSGDRRKFERYFRQLSNRYRDDLKSRGVAERIYEISGQLQNA